jgi:hypothetical protein
MFVPLSAVPVPGLTAVLGSVAAMALDRWLVRYLKLKSRRLTFLLWVESLHGDWMYRVPLRGWGSLGDRWCAHVCDWAVRRMSFKERHSMERCH